MQLTPSPRTPSELLTISNVTCVADPMLALQLQQTSFMIPNRAHDPASPVTSGADLVDFR